MYDVHISHGEKRPTLDCFLLNDQPTTCPYCSVRTNFEEFGAGKEMFQIHTCLRPSCGYVFMAVED